MFNKKTKLKLTDFECNLLINGMNEFRNMLPCIDEPYEWAAETLLERTERWAEGDLNIDLEPGETQQIILNILKKYA